MKADFWHERWQNDQIGFHRDQVNPYLTQFWSTIQAQAGRQILIPCCGKSLDLHWLARQGYRVTGLELSALATEAFFKEAGLRPEVSDVSGGRCWQAGHIRIFQGDLFEIDLSGIGTVDHVYDRGALIAMPESMRDRYQARLAELASEASTLLITLDYPTDEMSGPPFAIDKTEVQRRYAPCKVHQLFTANIIGQETFFQEKGLTRLDESVYLVQPELTSMGQD